MTTELQLIEAARICHETNRGLCAALGDNSQPTWDESPDWQKNSAVAGVRAIVQNPGTTPEQSHQNWKAHKAAEGWVYGPEKDPEKKEHPCMVDYKDLPPEQRVKDYVFGAVVRGYLGIQ